MAERRRRRQRSETKPRREDGLRPLPGAGGEPRPPAGPAGPALINELCLLGCRTDAGPIAFGPLALSFPSTSCEPLLFFSS